MISAAHCFPKSKNVIGYRIILGEHHRGRTEATEQFIDINRHDIIIHSKYKRTSHRDDIAVVTLSQDAKMSNHIAPICLPRVNAELKPGTLCHLSGWGRSIWHGSSTKILQEITVPVVDPKKCMKRDYRVTSHMLCTGDDTFKSACHGDSGGGLACRVGGVWGLYGVVSWGNGICNGMNMYSVFTKVSKYIPWIERERNGGWP